MLFANAAGSLDASSPLIRQPLLSKFTNLLVADSQKSGKGNRQNYENNYA